MSCSTRQLLELLFTPNSSVKIQVFNNSYCHFQIIEIFPCFFFIYY